MPTSPSSTDTCFCSPSVCVRACVRVPLCTPTTHIFQMYFGLVPSNFESLVARLVPGSEGVGWVRGTQGGGRPESCTGRRPRQRGAGPGPGTEPEYCVGVGARRGKVAGPPGPGDSDGEMSNCSLILFRWAVEHNSASQAFVSPGHAGPGVEYLLARVSSWGNHLKASGSEPWMDSSSRSPRGFVPQRSAGQRATPAGGSTVGVD